MYPKGVEVTQKLVDIFGTFETKLYDFEKKLPNIKFPVTEAEFIKDKELQNRVEKYNNANKKNNTLELKPLYYLTLYLYDLAKRETVDTFYIGEKRIDQLEKIFILKEKGDFEITFKSGKEKFVLTDKWLIDKILSLSFTEDEIGFLMGSDVDINQKSEVFSYTDASSAFAEHLFEYLERENSAKELISYLIYISELVNNDSIIVSNDYINVLLRNYRVMQENKKKQTHLSIIR